MRNKPSVLVLSDNTTDQDFEIDAEVDEIFITVASAPSAGTLTVKPYGVNPTGDSTDYPMATLTQDLSQADRSFAVALSGSHRAPPLAGILFSTASVGGDVTLHIYARRGR